MGSTQDAAQRLEEGHLKGDEEGGFISVEGPDDWDFQKEILAGLQKGLLLDEHEGKLYLALLVLWGTAKQQNESGFSLAFSEFKKILGKGLQAPRAFRIARKRLEASGLIKVERNNSLPGNQPLGRGGVRLRYILLRPTSPNRTTWSNISLNNINNIYKLNIYKGDNTTNRSNLDYLNISPENHEPGQKLLDGVNNWEEWGREYGGKEKNTRGDLGDQIETWNGAHRLNYFLKVYKDSHGIDYVLGQGRGALERKVVSLNCSNVVFKKLVDWLADKRKVESIHFLPEQLNDFYRKASVMPDEKLEKGIKGEFLKVPYQGGEIAVVSEYVNETEKGKTIRALDAHTLGIITAAELLEWNLITAEHLRRLRITK